MVLDDVAVYTVPKESSIGAGVMSCNPELVSFHFDGLSTPQKIQKRLLRS